MATTLIIFN